MDNTMLGPVFTAEAMRFGNNPGWHHLLRLLLVLVLFLVTAFIFSYTPSWETLYRVRASNAESLFWVVIHIQLAALLLLTPPLVAGALAAERERKTVDLVLTTLLKPREIVLGRVLPGVLSLVCFALAGLPILAATSVFGGVEPLLLFAAYGMTLGWLLAGAAFSMLVSLYFTKVRDAMLVAFVGQVVYLVGTYLATEYVSKAGPSVASVMEIVTAGNPYLWMRDAQKLIAGQDPGANLLSRTAWLCGTLFAGSVCMLIWTVFRFRRVVLASPAGNANGRRHRRTRRLPKNLNPMTWKETRFASTGRLPVWLRVLCTLALLGAAWPLCVDRFFNVTTAETVFWLALSCGLLSLATGISVLAAAASASFGEKNKNTWDSLILTPQSAYAILQGQHAGVLRRARLLVVWNVGLAGAAAALEIWSPLIPLFVALAHINSLPNYAWIGLRCSYQHKTLVRATMISIIIAYGRAWLMLILTSVIACCLFTPFATGFAVGESPQYVFLASLYMSLNPLGAIIVLLANSGVLRATLAGDPWLYFMMTLGIAIGVLVWRHATLYQSVSALEHFNDASGRPMEYPEDLFNMRNRMRENQKGLGVSDEDEEGEK
jgi:hypothetical protein